MNNRCMNNTGFTLIELIATIALLGIIAVISFVSISGVVKKSKVNDCENLVMSIKSAVKEYVSDNRYNPDFSVSNIKVSDLNLSGSLVNPFTKEALTINDIIIEVTLKSNYTVDMVNIKNSNGNLVECKDERW